MAAPLAGLLGFITQTRGVAIVGLALLSLVAGMSVPLLRVGLSAGSLPPRAGRWMEQVRQFFGVLLLDVALWLVAPVLPAAARMVIRGLGPLAGAATLGRLDRLPERARAGHLDHRRGGPRDRLPAT